MIKHKLKRIELPEPVQVSYYVHDRVSFRIQPIRDTPAQTFTGAITCTPETSPLGCYHISTRDDIWFVLHSEIIEKIGEHAA